ncbi:Coproporphyrinogen oxidase [Trametopsis cervina]|nr:Coproporphyrinogen oxidase [Trametopsis cervina]
MSTKPMRAQVEEYILDLQNRIVTAFEKLDPNSPPFKRDEWTRKEGGRGMSCVFATPDQTTSLLEKAGVNISIVHGLLPPAAMKQMRAEHGSVPIGDISMPFFAAGISLVVHPRNPHAPTVHANYRYFEITDLPKEGETEDADGGPTKGKLLAWWFGGGCDLTPSYLYEEDAVHFHKTIKAACDPHGVILYPELKKWCDKYFYIPHRGESRGIGGIFFDDLCDQKHHIIPDDAERPRTPADIFDFVKSAGDAFIPSYLPILELRVRAQFTPEQRRWQLLRRGRYVEFNLVYDRGTKFGLATPSARIESVLMSLPETARWEYMSEVGTEEGSEEAKCLEVLRSPKEWV